jgi:hypothetical protein
MTRDEYELDICTRSVAAVDVPFKPDAFIEEWKPRVAECHDNVDYWVKHHVGYTEVRGWIYLMGSEPGPVVYTAHSVVRGPDGELFDITPLYNNDERRGRFITHVGDDATFLAMRTGIFITLRCQRDCPAPPLDPMWALQQYVLEPDEAL